MRLEANKPTQLPIDSTFHFGASTRNYVIRERPQAGTRPIIDELEKSADDIDGGLLGLPETEIELDVSQMILRFTISIVATIVIMYFIHYLAVTLHKYI